MKRCAAWHFSLFIIFIIFSIESHALVKENKARLSLELQKANLPEAIHLMAEFLHFNVLISPTVNGEVSLHFEEAEPAQAFELLLASHGLGKWRYGDMYLIAPQPELIQRIQEEMKWQTMRQDALPLLTKVRQIKYGQAAEIARVLHEGQVSLLSKRGSVRVDERTNSLCIQDTQGALAAVDKLINQLDVPVEQVLIKARLISIDDDFERELGIHFTSYTQKSNSEGPGYIEAESKSYSLAVAKLADGSLLDVKLYALENEGHAELISSPRLFTVNQQTASIEAGEEVPYQEVSEGGGTAVAFKKAVLGLKVTPQVLPGNHVLLQLQINQDRPSNKMILGVPTISTRQMITSVLVKTDQTIVLGGIYETNQEKAEQKLPFISQVPLLGSLLKQHHKQMNKRELLIFVTPHIITQTA